MPYHQPAVRDGSQVGLPYAVRFGGPFVPPGGVAPSPPVTITIPAGSSSVTFRYENSTPGTYTLTASPGAGPLNGKGACSSAQAIVMPAGLTLNNILAVTQPGMPPVLYVSRTDQANVAIIDVLTDGVSVANCVYQTHPVSDPNQDGSRDERLKCTVVRVFGSGNITSGTLSVRPDTNDARMVTVDATLLAPPSSYPDRGEQVLLYFAPSPALVGRCFDATLNLTGTNLILRDCQFECEVVG